MDETFLRIVIQAMRTRTGKKGNHRKKLQLFSQLWEVFVPQTLSQNVELEIYFKMAAPMQVMCKLSKAGTRILMDPWCQPLCLPRIQG